MADNKLKSLNEIFQKNVLFRIPDFQRGYSWEDKQLEDFWSDLFQLKQERTHYTGVLTVEEIDKSKIKQTEKWQEDEWLLSLPNSKAYYVIDGQQRLTTTMILLNAMLNVLDDEDEIDLEDKAHWRERFLYRKHKSEYKSYIFGYEKDDPSDEFYKTKILGQYSSYADKVPENTLYTSNLLNASEFFSKKLKGLDKECIKTLFSNLVNYFKFNFYEIDSELDVYVTFETMNNRGKSLSNLELLKNRLIYLSSLLEGDNARLRKDINEAWKTIYAYLGKSKKLDDDAFLFDHWVMYFGKYNRNEAASYAKYLLNEHFIASNIFKEKDAITEEDIRKYVQSLQKSIKYWFYIYNPSNSDYSNEIKEWLYKVNRLKPRHFSPLLMSVMQEEPDENEILLLLKEIERFIFLVFFMSGRRSHTGNSYIYNLSYQFFTKDEVTLGKLINEIRFLTDGGEENEEGEYFYKGYADIDNFKNNVSKNGYYDWSGITYFLYEYELHLKRKAKGDEAKVSWENGISKRNKDETIEHIYPQSATSPYWENSINKFVKKEKDRLKVLHSLGNLLLLSRSKNAELQNDDFPNKKENKNGRGFINGSYSEIDVSKKENWSTKEIRDRGIEMLEFMDKRWEINLDEWNITKEDLIGLENISEEK